MVLLIRTRNVVVQLVAVERALDMLLASSENISPFSAHGRGPKLVDVVHIKNVNISFTLVT